MNPARVLHAVSLLLLLVCAAGCGAASQRTPASDRASSPPPDPAPPRSIDDYAWLAGCWRGTGLGGECEESWSPPMAGAMVGTFRLVRGGEVAFYEILLIRETAAGFALEVKHFSPAFEAWEERAERVSFAAESVAPGTATFSGLRLERDGDRLAIELRMADGAGNTRWESFEFARCAR